MPINPATGDPLPHVTLQIGDLKLQAGEKDCYHITYPIKNRESDCVYTIAVVELSRDGCDLRTVGKRPWETGLDAAQVFAFCLKAIELIDDLIFFPAPIDTDG